MLALTPLVLLAACAIEGVTARATLAAMGFARIETRSEPWLTSPCQWSEPYATRFTAWRGDGRWTGVLCAESDRAERPMVRALRGLGPEPFRLSGGAR